MINERVATMIMVYLSLVLFSLLAIICFYNAHFFWNFQHHQLKEGLYMRAKFNFFIILGCAAILDIPQYMACWISNFPTFCRENTTIYDGTFCLHLIATCGFLYSVIIPAILWNDIIQRKDGNFWFTTSPLDCTKIFFRVFHVVYCIIAIVIVIGDIVYTNTVHRTALNPYLSLNIVESVVFCILPTILFFVVSCCLWSGLRLQNYVTKEQLGVKLILTPKQHQVLINWTFINVLLTCSYFLLVIIILSQWESMPSSYIRAFEPISNHYYIWLPLAQWLQFIFCSFCQIKGMQYRRCKVDDTHLLDEMNQIHSKLLDYVGSPMHSRSDVTSFNADYTSSSLGVTEDLFCSPDSPFYLRSGEDSSDDPPEMDNFFTTESLRFSLTTRASMFDIK